MAIQLVFTGLVDAPLPGRADWAWGLPLIVLTVLIHVVGLAMTRGAVSRIRPNVTQVVDTPCVTGVFLFFAVFCCSIVLRFRLS